MSRSRDALWLLGLLAFYFAAQVVLRLWASPYLELDEAALLVGARDYRAGYGPQLPLYDWIQVTAFALVGPSAAVVLITKNLCLWATYACLYHAMVRVQPDRRAVAATLSLFFLPDVAWEAQRTLSHSVALVLMTTASFAALARVLTGGTRADYALLGLAVGLGGLSKFNYWLLLGGLVVAALTLPELRRRLSAARLALSAAVAALVLLWPMIWLVVNRDRSLASRGKFLQGDQSGGPPWLNGLGESLSAILAGLALVGLVFLLVRWRAGRAGPPLAGDAELFARLLWHAGWIALLAFTVAMVVTGANRVTPRWLIPMFTAIAPALILFALRRDGGRGTRWVIGLAGALALIILAAIPASRLLTPSNVSVDYAALDAALAPYAPETRLVLPQGHDFGNLLTVAPARYEPSLGAVPDGRALLIVVPEGHEIADILAPYGLTVPAAGPARVLVPDIVDPGLRHGFDIHLVAPGP